MLAATRNRLSTLMSSSAAAMRRLRRDSAGNFGLAFAILAVPLTIAVGTSLDFARAFNIQSQLQTDLDSALLQVAKDSTNMEEGAIRAKVVKWFKAQESYKNVVSLKDTDITIDNAKHTVAMTINANMKTTFMGIVGLKNLNVQAKSTVQAGQDVYYEISVIIDKSASMLLAATTEGQAKIKTLPLNCTFACHDTAYTATVGGKFYNSYYAYAKGNGVTLRADVQNDAVLAMLDTIDNVDPSKKRIKVGLYNIGTDTTGSNLLRSSYDVKNGIRQVIAPTLDRSYLRTQLASNSGLNSSTSYHSTDFRALTKLTDWVTTNGDGKSAASPFKLVVMVTDGVQSSDYWVFYNTNYITPLNPAWCKNIKDKNVTMAVLYTEYLPWTYRSEYNNSVGNTMSSSAFTTTWGGTMPSAGATKRRDYIPTALTSCATKSDYFISASSVSDIKAGLAKIVGNYLDKVRLTN